MALNTAQVNVHTANLLGLKDDEFDRIQQILGRMPNFTELSIFSVMWSEHCSYKNSILQLKTLPREGGRLLVEAGEENAGLVDIGDGLACAFKIESHNHPSAIEPFQGAATGVGGIHRDIFTMGARPIAALNSLRFGNLDNKQTKHLLKGVVHGIGNYGNCFGVPTVGGEVYFGDAYQQNILVNAMSVGIVEVGKTVSAIAQGIGNPVYIVGSATGKDGIHGATFASADLTENSADDLPAVQVGDPFQEKLLLEATLEAIATGAIVGMQDMGAAGITCSTSEMSAKGSVGMRINLDKVPTRQKNMQPFEILLSESQERMLIVCHKGKEHLIEAVFEKWDLPCAQIGEVVEGGLLTYYHNGEKVAEVPAHDLVLGGGAPVYERETARPAYLEEVETFKPHLIPEPTDYAATAMRLVAAPNIASKCWIYEQYDSMVRTNTMTTNTPSDAAVVRVKGTNKALALTTDCNPFYVYANPHKGAMIAVCEAARNIICTGGEPVAITNCLNFGNPYNPEVYWQFVHAIQGMGEACRALGTPVTGGNVSFYNQSVYKAHTEPVYPTPTIGMLGILDDVQWHTSLAFRQNGDLIYVIGKFTNDIGSSEYLRTIHGVQYSYCPQFELADELLVQNTVKGLIRARLINAAHDIADGGLFVTLLESAMASGKGVVTNTNPAFRKDAYWFGESQSRIMVTVPVAQEAAFLEYLAQQNAPYEHIGEVFGDQFSVDNEHWGSIEDFKQVFMTSIGDKMEMAL